MSIPQITQVTSQASVPGNEQQLSRRSQRQAAGIRAGIILDIADALTAKPLLSEGERLNSQNISFIATSLFRRAAIVNRIQSCVDQKEHTAFLLDPQKEPLSQQALIEKIKGLLDKPSANKSSMELALNEIFDNMFSAHAQRVSL